jgi:gamma-glutamylcyclotransferase (GGCT)/AIG2-like uncharacterized protein YtfP
MRHYIFVYGTLKRGQALHHRLNQKPLFNTTISGFDMYTHPNIWYPALTKGTRSVIGEVYEVTPLKLKEIDEVEGVSTGLYVRESVEIIHPRTYVKMKVYVYLKTDVKGWFPVTKKIVEWPIQPSAS